MAQTLPNSDDLLRAQKEDNLEFLRRLRHHALGQLRKMRSPPASKDSTYARRDS